MTPARLSFVLAAAFGLAAGPALAGLIAVPVAEGVHALVGEAGQRSADNLGNNATFGVVVTDAGVAPVDAGSRAKGAPQVDQSAFAHLEGFDTPAGRNAQQDFFRDGAGIGASRRRHSCIAA
ncbi:MAG: hypothetical protein ACOY5U_13690 [Pseudomonadota bacterium]